MSEQNISQEELAYKEAFNKAIDEMEKPTRSSFQDSEVKDSSTEKENVEQDKLDKNEWKEKEIAQQVQAELERQQQEEEQPRRRRGRPRKDEQQDADSEYEKIYSEYKQNAEAQIGLYKTRLQQLAQDYQDLKAKLETGKAEEPDKLPDEVQEVFEMYPDIAKAVSAYVDSKLNKVKQSFTQDVEQQIRPIKSHLVLSDVQKHEMAIKAAHPDIQSILQSGDLTRWIDTLPPVMRAGAQQVYQYGDTDAVISLLDEYKKQRGISNAPRSTRKQSGSQVQSPTGQNENGLPGGPASHSQLLGMESGPGNGGNNSSSDDNWGRGRGSDRGETGTGRTGYGGAGYGRGDANEDSFDQEDDQLVQRVMAALAVKSNKAPVDINSNATRKQKTADDIFKELTAQYEQDMSKFRRR